MINDYVISEKDSNLVFGVIRRVDDCRLNLTNKVLIRKVSQAIQDEFCYPVRPKNSLNSIRISGSTIYMSFDCVTDDDDEEIREVELNLTAIY
jgi:hypothetical protein